MSTVQPVFSTRKRNQASSPGECCSQANRRTHATARACGVSFPCHTTDPVGRLEPMPDTAQADKSFAHTNGHYHASPSRSSSARCSRSPPIDTAGTQTCSVDVGTASGTQRLWRIRALRETSPVRHSHCLRPSHRPSFHRIGMAPVLSSHQARRKGAVSVSCRAFFSGYARDFFHSILLISNISFFAFNINCINKCNKNMFHTEYE